MQEEKLSESRIRRIDNVCELLLSNEREASTCFFCGEKGKCVYKVDITDTAVSPESFRTSCCVRCLKVIPRKTIV